MVYLVYIFYLGQLPGILWALDGIFSGVLLLLSINQQQVPLVMIVPSASETFLHGFAVQLWVIS